MNKRFGFCILLLLTLLLSAKKSRSQSFDTSYAQTLQNAVNALKTTYNLVGVSAAVYVPGQGIWAGTAGISEQGVDLTPEMVFSIGSITKNFVAPTILQLAEADSLSIDDPIYKYLPSFANIDSTIPIRMLLNHTSGIYNFTDNPAFSAATNADFNRFWEPEDALQYVLAPNFPPGTSYRYSNTNYTLLGMIIKKIMHRNYSEEMHARFFGPLGMTSSYLEVYDTLHVPFAHNWIDLNGDGVPDDASFIPRTSITSASMLAGGIISRPKDLLIWVRNLFTPGRILNQNSFTQLTTFNPATGSGSNGYGFGTMRYSIGGRTCWGHSGNIFGHSGAEMYYPQDSICMSIMFTTNINTGPPAVSFMNTVLNNIPTGINGLSTGIPEKYTLDQNYPNPFNPSTKITYCLPVDSRVSIKIFDMTGKEVSELVNKDQASGSYSIGFSATDLSSGIYFYQLIATGNNKSFVKTMKMMLVK